MINDPYLRTSKWFAHTKPRCISCWLQAAYSLLNELPGLHNGADPSEWHRNGCTISENSHATFRFTAGVYGKVLVDNTFKHCGDDDSADSASFPNRNATAHGAGGKLLDIVDSLNNLLLTHFVISAARAFRDCQGGSILNLNPRANHQELSQFSEAGVSYQDDGAWLRTNEIEEFIDALQHCAELASGLALNTRRWKWIIIAIHNALQGACTCALRGIDTAGINIRSTANAKAFFGRLNLTPEKRKVRPEPSEYLANLMTLYERIQQVQFIPEPHCLRVTEFMSRDVRQLNDIRNEFIHFMPKGLSLELSGMTRIVRTCCNVIEHLAVNKPTFWHHLDDRRVDQIQESLQKLRMEMDTWMKLMQSTQGRAMPSETI